MAVNFPSLLCPSVVVVLALHVSCSQISTNARTSTERREQSNDLVMGGAAMAGAAFRATAVAAVRQPVTTLKTGIASLWNRPRAVVSGIIPQPAGWEAQPVEVPGSLEFEQLLDRKRFPTAENGSVKFLVDGRQFFTEMDREITAAKSSIHMQVFIFDNDDIGVRYADRLKARARELPVRVLFDDLGSSFAYSAAPSTLGPGGFVPPADMHAYLKTDSQIRVRRILNPWLTCDHTKLLIFDQKTAMLGGMNIGREYYSEWHDLMVRVEGPVVQSLAQDFNRAWRKAGPSGDLALFQKPAIFRRPRPSTGGFSVRVMRTDPAEGRYEINDSILLAIRAARRRVWIENPYFADDQIVAEVAAAARRGVDVRVVIPASGDSAIMDSGNLATANGLIRAGAKIFRYPKMTHMKVMICDDWVSLGSANLDNLSMRINRELNLAFSDGRAVRDLERAVFLPDFQNSRRLRLAETESPTSAVAELIADQL